jgi:hypothetical protein
MKMSKDNKGGFKKTTSVQGFQHGMIKKTKFDIKKNLTDYNYYLGSATKQHIMKQPWSLLSTTLKRCLIMAMILEQP